MMDAMSDPIGYAMLRWLRAMGIPEPTEHEYALFMAYNLAVPDVRSDVDFVTYVNQLEEMESAIHRSTAARIWFHIALFKAATYEIEADLGHILRTAYPEQLADFKIDRELTGEDIVSFAKAVDTPAKLAVQ